MARTLLGIWALKLFFSIWLLSDSGALDVWWTPSYLHVISMLPLALKYCWALKSPFNITYTFTLQFIDMNVTPWSSLWTAYSFRQINTVNLCHALQQMCPCHSNIPGVFLNNVHFRSLHPVGSLPLYHKTSRAVLHDVQFRSLHPVGRLPLYHNTPRALIYDVHFRSLHPVGR